ncbi:MAG TPA: hypothetical protein VFS44_04010 [Gemmatimonadaceae bacterium]|nr:hypothetical protein [Gemmatimonadaceae bacterium]
MRSRSTLLIAAALAACGSGADAAHRGTRDTTAEPTVATPSSKSGDEWTTNEVVKRLTEAGLVVTDSGEPASHPGIRVQGHRLRIGDGELEVYLYPDAAARQRDAAKIDTTGPALPSIYAPRWIMSGNLIAILHTPHDRTAERVENTLTARHEGG